MTPEGKIKQVFAREAKRHGLTYINLIQTGSAGDPDKLLLPIGGRPVFAEFKAPAGRLSKYQVAKLQRYQNLGYEVRVIVSEESAVNLVHECVKLI